jgi:dTDP-4-dehydrorhamnose 3,5-epimerase
MQNFDFFSTPLAELYVVKRNHIEDSRGSFSRFFCEKEFLRIGFSDSIVQINHTVTKRKGTIRGFHYQNFPCTETKIVSCIRGKVLDIAVDIRHNSPTFLQWHAEELSEKNRRGMYIPNGFAHGFQALEDDCELIYMHSEFYNPDVESAINVLDPEISMEWPLERTRISEKDASHPMININKFKGIKIK